MNEPTIETLARRLDRVERENRRLKKAGVVALAVIAAVVLMGQVKAKKVVEAEKFVLRNNGGIIRAMLSVRENHNLANLAFFDEAGSIRIALGAGGDGPSSFFGFYDQGGKNRVSLLLNPDVGPILKFRDEKERDRAELRIKDGASMYFYNKAGKVIWSAP